MNVLIVCSGNTNSVFVDDQVNSLRDLGVNISYYRIKGKGLFGYLRAIPSYLRTISNFKPDLIHAHFGLSGLFANLQFNFPVITTYHGCDINRLPLLILSLPPLILSKFNIFVSQKQLDKVSYLMSFLKKHSVLPCGVDTSFSHL